MVRRAWAAMGLWVALCGGCARPEFWIPDHKPHSVDDLTGGLPVWLGDEMTDGNAVEVVNNGHVFEVLEREIRSATSTIHMELFIWRDGKASAPLIRALAERGRVGVQCRIIVDPLESPGFEETVLPQLAAAGCDARVYKPIFSVRPLKEKLERNHRKIMVFDGKRAITGGFGIWDSWLGDAQRRDEWRDVNLFVRGPVVRQLQRTFAEDWRAVKGGELPSLAYPALSPEGTSFAAVVASAGRGREHAMAERATQLLIWSARKRLWVANSYFVPSEELSRLLVSRAQAGVDVRVLVPGDVHDMALIFAGQRDAYRRLLAGGVKIFEYRPTMLHSKVILVDDRIAFVGSTNFDPLALRCVKEASLLIDDPSVVSKLERDFLEDLSQSRRVRKMRPALGKFLARRFLWNFVGGIACAQN